MAKQEFPFNPRPPISPQGNSSDDEVHLAVGRALSAWEYAEDSFANIFRRLVAPGKSGYAARRAYGNVIAALTRDSLIKETAKIFFRNFPDEEIKNELDSLLKIYCHAGARRNEIAHGMVMGGPDRKHKGRYLTASVWTSRKRDIHLMPSYFYTAEQIDEFRKGFYRLAGQAGAIADQLERAYYKSPKKSREAY